MASRKVETYCDKPSKRFLTSTGRYLRSYDVNMLVSFSSWSFKSRNSDWLSFTACHELRWVDDKWNKSYDIHHIVRWSPKDRPQPISKVCVADSYNHSQKLFDSLFSNRALSGTHTFGNRRIYIRHVIHELVKQAGRWEPNTRSLFNRFIRDRAFPVTHGISGLDICDTYSLGNTD